MWKNEDGYHNKRGGKRFPPRPIRNRVYDPASARGFDLQPHFHGPMHDHRHDPRHALRAGTTPGDEADEARGPSKSQRKRDMHALQELGEALVALPGHKLARVPLDESLRDAIEHAQSISSHEGRRRQLQYVGKLMRSVDPAPIQAALDLLQAGSRAATALHHRAEHWRERLLNERGALEAWRAERPLADLAQLQVLLDAARTELSAGQGGRRYRELFRLLRDTLTTELTTPRHGAAAPDDPMDDET